jgi:hypothetical protein
MGAKSAQRSCRRSSAAPHLWLAAGVLLASSLVAAATGVSWAQTSRPTIVVADTILAEAAAQAPFLIRVGPPSALPRGTFVRVRGLPALAALSDGHSIAPGSWAVPLTALADLKITLPVTTNGGRTEITITLVATDGAVLAEARSLLVVLPQQTAGSQGQAKAETSVSILRAGTPEKVEPPPQFAPVRGPKLSPEERERIVRMMKRGDEQLAQGGIAQARLLYERAAEAGLAEAAMALAATYDSAELDRLGVLGLKPDREAARRWYERARQLGAPEAEQRLSRLGVN